jgi:tartrate-resistant acid phosphatase type 5
MPQESTHSPDGQAPQAPAKPPSPARRRFLLAAGVAAAAAAAGGAYYWWLHSLPSYSPPDRRAAPPPVTDEVRIAAIGDWGSHDRRQGQVAAAMEDVAAKLGGFHCGMLLGDNFYWSGVKDVNDPVWRTNFEEPYDTEHLGLMTWHGILGNHDYLGNAEAQIEYTAKSGHRRWHMPGHYYQVDLGPGRDGWGDIVDPEAAKADPIVTLLAIDNDDGFTKRKDGSWATELRWLEERLAALKGKPQWVILMAHHPIYSYSKHDPEEWAEAKTELKQLVEKYPPAVYIGGDDHNMQAIDQHGTLFVVAGCGGKNLYDVKDGPGMLFGAKEFGFALITAKRNKLTLEFINRAGITLWSHSLAR